MFIKISLKAQRLGIGAVTLLLLVGCAHREPVYVGRWDAALDVDYETFKVSKEEFPDLLVGAPTEEDFINWLFPNVSNLEKTVFNTVAYSGSNSVIFIEKGKLLDEGVCQVSVTTFYYGFLPFLEIGSAAGYRVNGGTKSVVYRAPSDDGSCRRGENNPVGFRAKSPERAREVLEIFKGIIEVVSDEDLLKYNGDKYLNLLNIKLIRNCDHGVYDCLEFILAPNDIRHHDYYIRYDFRQFGRVELGEMPAGPSY